MNTFSRISLACLTFLLLLNRAQAQPTFSIDVQGPTAPGSVSEGDILTPTGTGTIPPPAVAVSVFALGVASVPGARAEVDALSYGTEPLLVAAPGVQHSWTFSVDEFAIGRPGVAFPSVTTEGAFGAQEASADIYASNQAPGPVFPYAGSNVGLYDGNGGVTPFLAPGLNLVEPNPPTINGPDPGDNLDAWDLDQAPPVVIFGQTLSTPIYFSLDAQYSDPFEGTFANQGSAVANSFVSGDVLVSVIPGIPPTVFASAASLGLDQSGPDHDDLDALVLRENGDGVFTPSTAPYSWTNGIDDMLLFSVRRGSQVIGQIDSFMGLPIEEGDILMPPTTPGGLPGIFVTAEALGLVTVRTFGIAATFKGLGDDLDGLDVQQQMIPEPACLTLAAGSVIALLCRRHFSLWDYSQSLCV